MSLAVTRISTDGPPRFTAYLRDISERLRIERHRNTRLAVTQVLSQAARVGEATLGILRAICESLGWDAAFFWTLDSTTEKLRLLTSYHLPALSFGAIEAATRQYACARGDGLPGHIWATGKPAWIPDIRHDARLVQRAVTEIGLHGAFACPVILGDETLGVMEFFSRAIREPDVDLLEMMGTVAGQIGQFLERKEAEERVRFQANLLDSVGQAAIVTDAQGRIIYWNRFAETLYGSRGADVLGRRIVDVVVAPTAADQAAEIMGQLRAGHSWSGEFQVRRRDGTIFPAFVTDTPIFDGDGQLQAIIGISADITERKRMEHTLRFLADASATLATVVDYESTLQKVAGLAVPHFADWCAVDMVDADNSLRRLAVAHVDPGKVKLAHEFHRRFPPDLDAPNGLPLVLRSGKSDRMEDIPDALLVQGAVDDEHLRLLRELGLKSYMCVPLKGRDKVVGAVSFVSAESGRHYTEADLAFAEELARRASIAIENASSTRSYARPTASKTNSWRCWRTNCATRSLPFATPCTSSSSRERMERRSSKCGTWPSGRCSAWRGCWTTCSMSRGFSRGRIELRREDVDVAAVIERTAEAVQSLIAERRHKLNVLLPAKSLRVEGDPTRLEQVLTNLLNNAAKYTDPGGQIWLAAEQGDGEIVVRMRDTGIGIAPEMLPRIFDLFVQAERRLDRSQGGVGIGLTLVKKLVELHGGKIKAASAGLGKGASLPCAYQRCGANPATRNHRPPPDIPPPNGPAAGCWWWTTIRMRRIASPCCWNLRAKTRGRCMADQRPWPQSKTFSRTWCFWISGCRVWTATKSPGACGVNRSSAPSSW